MGCPCSKEDAEEPLLNMDPLYWKYNKPVRRYSDSEILYESISRPNTVTQNQFPERQEYFQHTPPPLIAAAEQEF